MTDIEWPEGATHTVDGRFVKWDGGELFVMGHNSNYWVKPKDSWGLDQDMNSTNHNIIERPKEPVINWDEQPTHEHVLLVDSHLKTKHWVKMGIGYWVNDTGLTWSLKTEDTLYSIHTKPPASKEPEPYKPEVGEWCEVHRIHTKPYKGFYIGMDNDGHYVMQTKTSSKLERLNKDTEFRPIKSEREQFIEKFHGMDAGQMYDNGARFTDDNS